MTNIAGVYNKRNDAARAVSELLDAGFREEVITFIDPSAERRIKAFPAALRKTAYAVAGAGIGGVASAVVAGLPPAGHGAAFTLAGYAVISVFVAVAGALSGALITSSATVDEARKYLGKIRPGKFLVIIHSINDKVIKARIALRHSEAIVSF